MPKPEQANGQHRLRQGRFSEPGRPYLLTTVTAHRSPIFGDLWSARTVVGALRQEHESGRAHSHAFVLMPDHLHWLVSLPTGNSLSNLMRSMKGFSARQLNRRRPDLEGSIWQPGFHDRALRKEEDLREAARYLVANPLRAGLVSGIGDYPHWDAQWLEPGSDLARSMD
jgi:REP element-mobilizing transposase RayT